MVTSRSRRLIAAAVFTGSLIAIPGAANAATRYADPASADTTGSCTSAAPCRIDRAISVATAGEDVVLKPGTYNINFQVAASAAINVYGEPGQPRPRLAGSANFATLDMSFGGTLTDVVVTTDKNLQFALSVEGVVVDRVLAEASGSASGAVELRPNPAEVVFRNSVARGMPGSTADGIMVKDNGNTGATRLIGATSVSAGARALSVKTSSASTIAKNSIFRGSTDIEVKYTALAPAVSYSAYRPAYSLGSINAGTGNTPDAPLFVDEANGDFHQATGSPTIGAGAADALTGSYDADRLTRTIGAIDIGAYEDQADTSGSGGSASGDSGSANPESGSTGSETGGDASGPGSTDGGGDGTASGSLPPRADPVLGLSVGLGEVSGTPRVRLPGSTEFVPLTADASVPVGAVIDATRGTVELTSVRDGSGRTQTGTFWGGLFQVRQSRTDTVTELVLTGGDFSGCRGKGNRRGKVVASRTSRHSSRVRRLWGSDRGGRFRTRGRHGSATVRGTRWLTEDRCDGTLFKVTEGAIDVRDDRRRKTVRLKRGKTYLATAAAKKKRR